MAKIEVENLTKVFGKRPNRAINLLEQGKSKDEILKETGCTVGVNRTNFSVEAGEIFVIMGLSGSGKSTLVRLLNRLIDPTEGSVWVDGDDLARMDDKGLRKVRREKMSMVFQQFGLFPFRTILDNVAYGLEIQGLEDQDKKKKAEDALQLVGLGGYGNMYPDELSGGMQQRVGLARALAADTDILLMDEAFSALDPLIRKEMQDELLELQERMQKTIVFITHDLDEALRLGDRITIMKDGRIVQIGTPEDILQHPADDYVAQFVEDVDRSKVFTAEAVMKRPETLTIDKDGPRVALQRMKKEGISSLYVTNKDRTLLGIVHADEVSELVEQGSEDMRSVLHENVPAVQKDTVVKEMIELLTYKNTPVAVVDEDNRLVGIVVRGSVMALLSGKEVEAVE
ncbi:glycine betaine/L-proline ABC transporter ATP-binding protein [Marinococcus halophilus]|uniref:Quaternary amine transport ATP-binding protein n=1 Tax=Marinococcus halophilus TaxID=1371 RepID=A0A510Y6Y9_MARHA|nr:glycine betaine/L-proline ABC transporter ATP-binding protein [Marinococcus halophilus]OZT79766.1 glycine betaine/L-proline ABC transporter ATP-binding protein [Marinococcus halophilus]GEK59125.1 glycine/betaine ABC transporter ATP-binding protein [Marinococcus halophilus]